MIRQVVHVQYKMGVRFPNYCCREKAVRITYLQCVSIALFIQHAKHMLCVVLSSVACLAVTYSSTLSHRRYDFRRCGIGHKMCVWFSLQMLSVTFLIIRRIPRDIIVTLRRSSCKVTVILSDFNETWISGQIFEKFSNIKFRENPYILPCGRRDMTKLIITFRNFTKAPKYNFWCFYKCSLYKTVILTIYFCVIIISFIW